MDISERGTVGSVPALKHSAPVLFHLASGSWKLQELLYEHASQLAETRTSPWPLHGSEDVVLYFSSSGMVTTLLYSKPSYDAIRAAL